MRFIQKNILGQSTKAYQDLLGIGIISVILMLMAVYFDAFDRFVFWYVTRKEPYELEEIIPVFLILSFAFAFFSWRRWQELVLEIKNRMQTEESLRESEMRYNELTEQNRTYAWEVDSDGFYTYVSHVVEHVSGYLPDEVVGRLRFYDLHPEEGREAFKDASSAVFKNKERFRDIEHRIQRKDGGILWVSTNGIPLLSADGTLHGYRGISTDITERQLAVLEGQTLLVELQQALAEIKTLSGLIPICAYCKKIRDDKGYWNQLESYISKHSDALFSHSICPDCYEKERSKLKG